MKSVSLISHAGLWAVVCVSACSAATSFHGLGDLPGNMFFSRATAVSGDGRVVVGESYSAATLAPGFSTARVPEAFRWTRERGMVGLGDFDPPRPPSEYVHSTAYDVSDDGQYVVGQASSYPVRWGPDGSIINLGAFPFGTRDGIARSVSANGSIVSGSAGAQFRWEVLGTRGPIDYEWMLAQGFVPVIQAMSATGEVMVGAAQYANDKRTGGEPMIWTAETGFEPLGYLHGTGVAGLALAVSSDGQTVVGWSRTASAGAQEAFRWTRETGMRALGLLTDEVLDSKAFGVSGDGSIVVGHYSVMGLIVLETRAFAWSEAIGMLNLQGVIEAEGITGIEDWVLTEAVDVSRDGKVIVGTGINPQGNQEGWILELYCDLNQDLKCNAADIDLLSEGIRAGNAPASYDLNLDGVVDSADRRTWVVEEKRTYFGDSNLDRVFNTTDLVAVFLYGQYEDAISGNSTWASGDWDGDGDFNSTDMIDAFVAGVYEAGTRTAVAAVPEPSTALLTVVSLLLSIRALRVEGKTPRTRRTQFLTLRKHDSTPRSALSAIVARRS